MLRGVSETGSVTREIHRIGNVVSAGSRSSVDRSGTVMWHTSMSFGFTDVAGRGLPRSRLFAAGTQYQARDRCSLGAMSGHATGG